MRALVILGSSTSSATATTLSPPPPYHHHHQRSTRPPSLSRSPPPSISTVHSLPASLSALRCDPKPQLRTLADLASGLAADGRLDDFAAVADHVVASGAEASLFVAELDVELVGRGLARGLREGRLWSFVEALRMVEKLGIAPAKFVDGAMMNLLGKECERLMDCGDVKSLVQVMETLAGFKFPVRELVKPADVIRALIDQRMPNLAIRYACIFPHAQILFCTIIHEFGKKGDLVSALKAYEACKTSSSGPNMFVYRKIIDVCGLCGDAEESRHICEDLLNQGIVPNIYVFNSLMNVNAHDLSYTLHIYKTMQNVGVTLDMATYNILLKACCLAGRVDLAKEIYQEVRDLESTRVLKLDVFTYSTIIKVFADAKLWQMALQIKDDMLRAGVTPNTVTWSSLISACAKACLVERAIQLFEEMLLAGCEPNSQCCNILLHACVEACQFDRAFRLFQAWKDRKLAKTLSRDHGSRKQSLSSIVRQKENSSHAPENASKTRRTSFSGRFPFSPTTTTYNILMKACGTDYRRAKALMEEMKAAGLTPNHISWSILIDLCGGAGNVEGALQLLKTMRAAKIQPDVIAYTTAIKVCVDGGQLKRAFSLYEEMKRYQVEPNLVTYNTLLRARSRYGSLHEVRQCLAIYQDMRKAGYKPNDHYLKALIEEWCEGVIQDNDMNQGEVSSIEGTDLSKPNSLLLEKVAVYLQRSIAESLAMDLQGLSKVEARIVVLAVLRMIKENYSLGNEVNDDVLIILGVSEINAKPTDQRSELKDAIVKLLKNELGIDVLLIEPRSGRTPSRESETSTRRPVVLQRIKLTRKSLHDWLHRRAVATSK
ncbi:hypothetical protein NL676_002888 [Syzygium grande]|nr:hypothetical protein NL676_002888 [Syzygium grande]